MVIVGIGGQTLDALNDLKSSFLADDLYFYTDIENDKNTAFFLSKSFNVLIGKETLENHFRNKGKSFICFIGNNLSRHKRVEEITMIGGEPSAFLSKYAHADSLLMNLSCKNTIVMDYTHISANVEINEGAIIYTHTSIAHDVVIGKYAFISAYCAISNSEIGDYTFVGLNSMIGPGVKVGKHCIIGANSYVKSDLPDGVIAVGSPAKIIGENKNIPK